MFNNIEIGAMVRKERNAIGETLESFAPKVGISRQTLSKWENGQGTGPTVDDLLRMCDLFNCDFGYLVGEYSCKRRVSTDIQDATGLSEEACAALAKIKNNPCSLTFIDSILKAPPSLIEKMAKKQIAYAHIKNALAPVIEKYSEQIKDNSIIIDASIDGEKLPQVPIQDLNTYALFDLWLAFSEFINTL